MNQSIFKGFLVSTVHLSLFALMIFIASIMFKHFPLTYFESFGIAFFIKSIRVFMDVQND